MIRTERRYSGPAKSTTPSWIGELSPQRPANIELIRPRFHTRHRKTLLHHQSPYQRPKSKQTPNGEPRFSSRATGTDLNRQARRLVASSVAGAQLSVLPNRPVPLPNAVNTSIGDDDQLRE